MLYFKTRQAARDWAKGKNHKALDKRAKTVNGDRWVVQIMVPAE